MDNIAHISTSAKELYPHFEEAGYELTTSSFVSEGFWKVIYQKGQYPKKVMFTLMGYFRRVFDLFRLRQFDVVYVHLWVTPIGPPIFEWLVKLIARKIIYDIDDLVYLNDQRKNNKIMLLIRGKTKPISLMKTADHVICCTPMLEGFVRQYNDQVTDISSTINTEVYKPKLNYEIQGKPVIGWSGSHSTSRFLHLLAEPLKKLAQTHPFLLKVIGDPEFKMEGIEVRAISWSAEREVEELKEIDIGLYPLPLDEEWVYGKSGLKALQYMALGIPTLASAIGANY
ncbi:MAG: glycosyltransferase, partial [Bacteroidota bacterium]